MTVDWSTIHKVLRDETRKQIVLNLHGAGRLTYTDLMNRLQITNTGTLNYHLKKLNNLIEKDDQGAYTLTEKGAAAAELLEKLPSQIPSTKALRASDALLIGALGFFLLLPPLFQFMFVTGTISPTPITDTLGILLSGVVLSAIYPLLVPSAVMWWLAVRRTHNHDLYDLMKPPATAAGIFYLLLLAFYIVQRLNAIAYQSQQPITQTQTQTLLILPSLPFLPLTPVIGVLIIEGLYRLRNR